MNNSLDNPINNPINNPLSLDPVDSADSSERETLEKPEKSETPKTRSHIAVPQKNRILLVRLQDIIFLGASNKQIEIVTGPNPDQCYTLNGTLNELEKGLGDAFIRLHRNTIANTKYIRAVEVNDGRLSVSFHGLNETRQVSRRETSSVNRWLRSGGSAG